MYSVIDGRHRLTKARRDGIKELRCDVITPVGHALRIIPVGELEVDKDVQVGWSFSEHQIAKMGPWDDRKVGVLTVTPNGDLSIPEKADIKNGLDRLRRPVSALEGLFIDLERGDQQAKEVFMAAKEYGFQIGKTRGGGPPHVFACASALRGYHERLGLEGMRRAHSLNARWREDVGANNAHWLGALCLLVRDGYDEILTPSGLARLETIIPSREIRRARGLATEGSTGANGGGFHHISYTIAIRLRKHMRMKVLPVRRVPHDSHSRPLR